MLGTRADRVTPADAREVLAGVRARIADPATGERGGRAFGVQPVRLDGPGLRRRGSQVPWRLAVLGVAAVLAVAVLGGRLSVGPTGPDTNASPSAGAGGTATVSPTTGPTTASSPIAILTPAELRAGLTSGGLDGGVVIVRSFLVLDPMPCPSPVPEDCFGTHVEGLDGVPFEYASAITSDAIASRVGTDAPLALRVVGRSLSFLGWVADGADGVLAPSELAVSASGLDRFELALVTGWLAPAHGEVGCQGSLIPSCHGPWPRLTDTPPFIGGTWTAGVPGIDVSFPSSFGLDGDMEVMPGHFLVTRVVQFGGSYAPYGVVATLDGEVQHVDQQATPVPTSSADYMREIELLRALRNEELDGRVVVVDGHLHLVYGRCLVGAGDCVFLQLDGVTDLFIDKGDLTVDEAGAAIARHPAAGPIALRVTGTAVGFIGWIADGGVDRPVDIAALASGSLALPTGDIAVVGGWLIGARATGSCPSTGASTVCPGSRPWLTATEPLSDGTVLYGSIGVEVEVAATLGLGDAPAELRGPFLVRASRASTGPVVPYEVVEQFVDVVSASSAAEPVSPPAGSLSAGELLTALEDRSLDGRIIEVHGTARMAGDCGYGVECLRFTVDGAPGLVLTWDGPLAGLGSSGTVATIETVTGTLVVQPRDGTVRLLGRLIGDLDAPLTIQEAFYRRQLLDTDPFRLTAVSGVLTRVGGHPPCPTDASPGNACALDEVVLSDRGAVDGLLPPDAPQIAVRIAAASGIGEVASSVVGPFLGRYVEYGACAEPGASAVNCSDARIEWTIQARYSLGDVLRLVLP